MKASLTNKQSTASKQTDFEMMVKERIEIHLFVNRAERSFVVPRKEEGSSLIYGAIDDPSIIAKMNICALRDEYVYNCDFVASNSKAVLEALSIVLERNREEYETFCKLAL